MGGFEIDADAVRTLAGLLDETGLGEIEYEVKDRRIRVVKPGVAPAPAVYAAAPGPNGAAAPSAPAGPEPGAGPHHLVLVEVRQLFPQPVPRSGDQAAELVRGLAAVIAGAPAGHPDLLDPAIAVLGQPSSVA